MEQPRSFLRETRESGVFELYYLELATGLRRGELLGPKWGDIDLKRGDLRALRQISRINGEVVEAPLKTKNAYRTLPLAEDTVSVLLGQKKKAGSCLWVFPSPNGGPIFPDSVLHMLHRVLKRAGLPKVRFHDLQHTFATLALQNGVDIKTVSGMLGHYSAGFTLDTYAHVTTAAQKEAARAMGKVLRECWRGSNPNVSPEQRGTFGKEAQRRERTLPRTARGEIRSLCRRGSKYRSNSRHKNKPGRKVIKKSAEIIRFQRIFGCGRRT